MVDMAKKAPEGGCCIHDPPRAGSDEKFLSSVAQMGPKKVVYCIL